ncbi:septum formation protein Maf [Candidatus Peribacteria bacterium]|jgi:septum formation protein|nr:septum formation protein Maf [Candidatus Peribacteria bacterium]MBT4021590.1 septum formation protein Maf [Candidatus Peribacteria bacterium]MBT4240750.1 septum formation protein Maf [Candidatus Peribacteria bacterium]MBT4474304.1 septum formation protein Maf [Candidatus Peribacteria bacterium]
MFILASKSPQRKEILERIGIDFEIIPPDFDETSLDESDPVKRAELLAISKAQSVSCDHPDRWVIGVDTLVVSENSELLEKPTDARHARRMLELQAGHKSAVHSGLCLMKGNKRHSGVNTSYVVFKKLSSEEIDTWMRTKIWQNRSGGFQIEGEGEKLFKSIEGEKDSIVGFPVGLFEELKELTK